MGTPLVSIISPTYNHEEYIVECLDSALSQTYPHWEMHIMDDGSTDRTGEIALFYAKKDARIKYHYQSNIGVHNLHITYNKALELCQGEYIAILECDDVWFSDKLERQVAALEKDNESILAWSSAYNSRIQIDSILKLQPDKEQCRHRADFENNPVGRIAQSLYFGNYIPALTIFIRKKILLEIGGFQYLENLPLIDQPTLLQLSLKGKFYFDEKPLGTWRRYSGQTTKKLTLDIMEGIKYYVQKHFDSLSDAQKQVINLTKTDIIYRFYTTEIVARSIYARACLMREEFALARTEYSKVIFFPHTFNLMWRIRSLVGYIMSLFRTDVELLAKILGKRYYK